MTDMGPSLRAAAQFLVDNYPRPECAARGNLDTCGHTVCHAIDALRGALGYGRAPSGAETTCPDTLILGYTELKCQLLAGHTDEHAHEGWSAAGKGYWIKWLLEANTT